jgi:hypothetical protein
MTQYYAVKFRKEIPTVPGVKLYSSFEGYTLISVEDGTEYPHLEDYSYVALTEDEVLLGMRYYGETRSYRKAYSDAEGLTPDADELANGKRKTKVYYTEADSLATVSLMKKVAARMVIDEFDTRTDRSTEADILAELDAMTTVDQICIFKEEKFGQEMPFPLARQFNLVSENEQRINPPIHGVKF